MKRRSLAAFALALVLALSTLAVSAPRALGEGESLFDIVSVAHNPGGVLTVSVAVTDVGALQAERFNAFVDGIPAAAQARSAEESDPLSIVIAVDTSGSMLGTPLASAKEAALQLIDELDERDEVAVVAFASEPEVLSRFTSDREETREVLSSLVAEGDTALYQAVATAAGLFAPEDGGPSILVLLSDGQDYGGASSVTREGSINAVRDGLTVYSFGLGAGADVAYLGEVAEVSGGRLWEVASSRSLGALFGELGTRLGATFTVDIAVPPLPLGEHALTVRSRTESGAAEASFVFNVSNEGLVTARVLAPAEPGDLIAIELQGAVPLNNLSMQAFARGEQLAFAAADRILVDPWAFEPGYVAIRIAASVSGQPAAQLTVAATIPALAPMLEVERDDRGETAELVVTGRAQGAEPPTISVIVDGEEIASTAEPQLRIPLPQSGDVIVRLARDATIATRSFSLAPPPALEQGASQPLWRSPRPSSSPAGGDRHSRRSSQLARRWATGR